MTDPTLRFHCGFHRKSSVFCEHARFFARICVLVYRLFRQSCNNEHLSCCMDHPGALSHSLFSTRVVGSCGCVTKVLFLRLQSQGDTPHSAVSMRFCRVLKEFPLPQLPSTPPVGWMHAKGRRGDADSQDGHCHFGSRHKP